MSIQIVERGDGHYDFHDGRGRSFKLRGSDAEGWQGVDCRTPSTYESQSFKECLIYILEKSGVAMNDQEEPRTKERIISNGKLDMCFLLTEPNQDYSLLWVMVGKIEITNDLPKEVLEALEAEYAPSVFEWEPA